MTNKLLFKYLTAFILIIACSKNFAQTTVQNQNNSSMKVTKSTSDLNQTIKLGVALSESQFKKITQYHHAKVVTNESDFCVGIMDDEELSKSIENIQYRVFQNKYAIEQFIFAGKTENFSVNILGRNLDKNTTVKQIKSLKAEIIQHKQKGKIVDRFNKRVYAYTETYSIRKDGEDDLIHAYFNAGKLIAFDYMAQC